MAARARRHSGGADESGQTEQRSDADCAPAESGSRARRCGHPPTQSGASASHAVGSPARRRGVRGGGRAAPTGAGRDGEDRCAPGALPPWNPRRAGAGSPVWHRSRRHSRASGGAEASVGGGVEGGHDGLTCRSGQEVDVPSTGPVCYSCHVNIRTRGWEQTSPVHRTAGVSSITPAHPGRYQWPILGGWCQPDCSRRRFCRRSPLAAPRTVHFDEHLP